MIVELGHYALVLAFVTALLQAAAGLWGGHARDPHAIALTQAAAGVQAALAALAFAALAWAHVSSDFSVRNVAMNSNSALPLIYRVAGVWGNHEGSLLLWITTLALLGGLVAVLDRNLPPTLRARVLGVQAGIAAAFMGFALGASDPFARMLPAPPDGRDLNPLLQDPGLAFHPPFLYLGFVGFSVAFAFGVAALLEGRVDAAWARWVRPWTLAAWTSLTLGIAMGAAWAYYVLGWGGFWSWDPVENGSLMPWLAGTALLHSAAVVEKRDTLKAWTILMAITAFSTSVLSTFVVRSGLLTSVHAFATDPSRGLVLLAICLAMTGGAFLLFALRASVLRPGGGFRPVSRESALVLNNVLLCAILATVALGAFWPILAEVAWGDRISVGAPYYVRTAVPLAVPVALFMTLGLQLPWKRGDARAAVRRLGWAATVTLLAAAAGFWLSGRSRWLSLTGFAMGAWMATGAVADIALRLEGAGLDPVRLWRRACSLPRSAWGGALAHAGLGVCLLGMTGATLWSAEAMAVMRPGDRLAVAGLTLSLDAVEPRDAANYQADTATISAWRGGRRVAVLHPERRWFTVAQTLTTQSANRLTPLGDLYVVLGDPRDDGAAYVVRAYTHPLVGLIWFGALMMTAGGALSLADRRYRIGAPLRRRRFPSVASPVPVPAE